MASEEEEQELARAIALSLQAGPQPTLQAQSDASSRVGDSRASDHWVCDAVR